MIQFIFTLDYEVYGNGKDAVRDLVVEPTARLAKLSAHHGLPFVVFVEAPSSQE